MTLHFWATTAAIAITVAACKHDIDNRRHRQPGADGPQSLELAAPPAYAPALGQTPWPTIHQNDRGTKEGAAGPIAPKVIDRYSGVDTILMTVGGKYLYHQSVVDTRLRLFDPQAVKKGPIREFDLGSIWPIAGGGNIDQYGYGWWTGGPIVIRLNEDLSQATYSADLLQALPVNAKKPTMFNSVNFLEDGTVLVSTMQEWAFLVDPAPGADGKFPVRGAVNKLDFTAGGQPVIKASDTYGPRPILDGQGGIYFVSSNALIKVVYDRMLKTFKKEALWAFKNPQNAVKTSSNMAISNPIIVGPYICAVTDPQARNVYQEVFCLDRQTGELKHRFRPFDKPGISAAHTLGGIEATNELFVIADDASGKGGVAGFSLNTGKKLWPNVPLNSVSDSLVLSAPKRRLYIMAVGVKRGTLELNAIDINSGARKIIDTLSSPKAPQSSLGAIDAAGNLFFPAPGGFTRYHD